MAREPISTWCFALVVVRLGRRFLLVQERKHGQLWYLPAGGVERGETFAEAARRETLEEAGLAIELEGILRVEHTPEPGGARLRVVFLAHPTTDAAPKTVADKHSLRAAWVTLDQLDAHPLRGDEVRQILQYVDRGGAVAPLGVLTYEGEAYDHSRTIGE